jgi:hypothetical protein
MNYGTACTMYREKAFGEFFFNFHCNKSPPPPHTPIQENSPLLTHLPTYTCRSVPIYAVIDKTRKRPQQQNLAAAAAQPHQEATSAAVTQQQLDSSAAAANPQLQNSSASAVACPQEQDSREAAASPQQRNSSVAVDAQQQQDLSAAAAKPHQQQISPVAVAQKPISSNTAFQPQEAANNDTPQLQEAVTLVAQAQGRTSVCSATLTTSLVATAEGRPEEAIENLELPAYPQPASFDDSQTGLSADFPAPPPEGAVSSDHHTESDLGYLETDFDLVGTALSASDENCSKVSGTGVTGGLASVVVAGANIASGDTLIASGGASVAAGGASVAVGRTNIASGSDLVASGGASVAAGVATVTVGGTNIPSGSALVASGGASVEGACENMPDYASSAPFDAVTAMSKAAAMRNYAGAHGGRGSESLAPFAAEKALLERRIEETETGLERGTEEGARNSVTFNSGFLYITQEQGKRWMDMK